MNRSDIREAGAEKERQGSAAWSEREMGGCFTAYKSLFFPSLISILFFFYSALEAGTPSIFYLALVELQPQIKRDMFTNFI